MAATATLAYVCTAVGPVSPAKLKLFMQVAPLPTDEFNFLDVSLVSDVTTGPVGNDVTRTLVFSLGPAFNSAFPAGTDQASLFRGLFKFILGNELNSKITEIPPIIA
jgi:hypothetical protein